MNKRNLIIGIIILIALVAEVVLWSQKSNQQETTQQTKKEITEQTQEQKTTEKQEVTIKDQSNKQNQTSGELKPEEKIDTSNWKTYWNDEFGFELKYPKSWEMIFQDKIKVSDFNGATLLLYDPQKSGIDLKKEKNPLLAIIQLKIPAIMLEISQATYVKKFLHIKIMF